MLAQLSKRSDLLTEYERLHLKKPNMRSHNERCRECKDSFQTLLAARFGAAERNWELDLPCKVSEYKHSKVSDLLLPIHDALQRYRGYADFVRSNRLSKADFFVPGPSLIFEFDESQHFTKPRDIALSHYPENREVGFSKTRWRSLCQMLEKRDNDPPFRDEQRAWYDTLKDFAPIVLGAGKTVRVYSRDAIWCSLNPRNAADLQAFDQLISIEP